MNDFAIKVLTAPLGKTHLFSVGQAGYIVKSKSGQLLGIDLYLSECVERIEGHIGFKRLLPQILFPGELIFDAIITTHPHRDHFDIDSVPELMANGKTKLFASTDCENLIEKLEMSDRNVTYVKSGDSCITGDFKLDFINCDHGSGAPDAVGIVVTVDDKKIMETGDTSLRLDWTEEYAAMGPFDIMIAPINGAYGNLDEEECASLASELKPGITVPCHYGMFASHGGNPGKFYEIMKTKYPENKFLLMAQGESYTFE